MSPSGFQLEEDLRFQRRSWRVERAGTWLLVLVLAAAAAGLLGSGPLSRGVASGGGLHVEFQRFAQYQTPERLVVRVEPAGAAEVRLWVDRAYLERVRVEAMLPPPVRVEGAADRVVFVFAAASGAPFRVSFDTHPEALGFLHARLGLAGEPRTVAFRQLVYP